MAVKVLWDRVFDSLVKNQPDGPFVCHENGEYSVRFDKMTLTLDQSVMVVEFFWKNELLLEQRLRWKPDEVFSMSGFTGLLPITDKE